MVLLVHYPQGYEIERRYTFDLLLREFLGLEYLAQPHSERNVTITLAGEPAKRLEIADVLFSCPRDLWLKIPSLPPESVAMWDARADLGPSADLTSCTLPVIYGRATGGKFFAAGPDGLNLLLDVFGSAFYMLTRYEEAVLADRDAWDRFPASASLASRAGFIERPIVNEYVEVLWAAMTQLWPTLRRRDRVYRALLSHDVDVISLKGRGLAATSRTVAADLLRRREPLLAARRIVAGIETKTRGHVVDRDPYNSFDFIMDTSERCGLQDSFFFFGGQSNAAIDATYDVDEPWVRALMRRISQRGHDIGLHTSYETYLDPARTKREFERLRHACAQEGITQARFGGRQHYLRWHNPTTWQNWADAGIDYDSSLTYPERVGFRSGCCYEHPVMNLFTRERLGLRERPLIAMESSLLTYAEYSLEAVEGKLKELIAICRRYKGDFTLLWHNHMLVGRAARETYERVVQAAAH